jgi:isocitrate/isopropylmalate dehydrogenase
MFIAVGRRFAAASRDVKKGIDFVVVRERNGGIYFGEHNTSPKGRRALPTDVMAYGEA